MGKLRECFRTCFRECFRAFFRTCVVFDDEDSNNHAVVLDETPNNKSWINKDMTGVTIGGYVIRQKICFSNSYIYLAKTRSVFKSPAFKLAAKVSRKDIAGDQLREYEQLRSLRHADIIKPIAYFSAPTLDVMVMEYVNGGKIGKYLDDHFKDLTMRMKYGITFQIITAINYIHENDLAHNDLKLENICMPIKGLIKIIDFGSALKISTSTIQDVRSVPTTLEYLPTEFFDKQYTRTTLYNIGNMDSYACGVTMFFLLFNRFTYGSRRNMNRNQYARMLRRVKTIYLDRDEWQKKDCLFLYVARKLLIRNPRSRITVKSAFELLFKNTSP